MNKKLKKLKKNGCRLLSITLVIIGFVMFGCLLFVQNILGGFVILIGIITVAILQNQVHDKW